MAFLNEQQELWLPVVGYEGLYEDSNLGRVKSLNYNHTGTERVLRERKNNNGYLYITLYKDGKAKTHRVHRLVAESFIPNPYNLPEVNHLDENPLNNRVSNLQWCDRSYNINYGSRNVKVAKVLTNHPSKSKPVLQYTVDGELVREWPSTHEAQRQGGYTQTSISACCLGKLKTYKGFIWRYKKEIA